MLKYFHKILLNETDNDTKIICNSQSMNSEKMLNANNKTRGESFSSFDDFIKIFRHSNNNRKDSSSVQPESVDTEQNMTIDYASSVSNVSPNESESSDDTNKKSNSSLLLGGSSPKKRLSKINEFSNHSIGSSEYSFYCPQLLSLVSGEDTTNTLTKDSVLPDPPSISGLDNCKRIIPDYYLLNKLKPGELFKIEYYEIIKDDIRNMRPLSYYHIQYIKDLSDEQKQEIIELFNISMKAIVKSLMIDVSNPSSPICSLRMSKSTKNN